MTTHKSLDNINKVVHTYAYKKLLQERLFIAYIKIRTGPNWFRQLVRRFTVHAPGWIFPGLKRMSNKNCRQRNSFSQQG